MTFSTQIDHFPITPYLEEICDAVKNASQHALVLTAETGAGKSTVLPLAVLQAFEGKILMTEPRRLAVVGVANRVSELLGESAGGTVGYKIHLETRVSPQTRLEVMTEAILIRMLQADPALEGVNLVVLDEFHERSVNTDLALAFLREAMELRDDLYVIIMSATIESKRISDFLGGAPVLEIPGHTFPVDIIYDDRLSCESVVLGALPSASQRTTGSASSQAAKKEPQNILVFLPGISEIRRLQVALSAELSDRPDVELCILHSSISFTEQKHILSPTPPGITRVILSSAIAETSLTVPGVTVVIDSGLSRVNRINIATGMESLITENESEFSAAQRAGRAGRERPGKCIRLWNKFDVRQKELQPEILRTDLSQLVLECSDRGIYELSKIQWLDSPTQNAWEAATSLLQRLGCIDEQNRILPRGRAALQLGVSVRLACIALDGMLPPNATRKIFTLSPKSAEFLIKYGNYSQSPQAVQNQFLENLEQKLSKIHSNLANFSKNERTSTQAFELCAPTLKNQSNSAILLLSGFPDRLGLYLGERIINGEPTAEYQFPSGRKAVVHNSRHTKSKWIVAPEIISNQTSAVIFDFEELPQTLAEEWLKNCTEEKIICAFENGKIIKQENICYGELVLSSKKLPSSKEDYAAAWCNEVRCKGLCALPLEDATKTLIERLNFLYQQNHQQNPSSQEFSKKITDLAEHPELWLEPFITGINLNAQTVHNAISWYFSEFEADKNAPEVLILQNGNRAKIKYEKLASPDDKTKLVIRPVIEVIIQRAFGCTVTPKIAGMKVLFRLLSPAQRPLQITDDLQSFWKTTWHEICKEMKGRYPKHNWTLPV